MNFVFREQWLFLFCNKVSEEHLSPIFVTFPVENRTVTMISDHSNLSHARDASGVPIASSEKSRTRLEVLKGSGSQLNDPQDTVSLSWSSASAAMTQHDGAYNGDLTELRFVNCQLGLQRGRGESQTVQVAEEKPPGNRVTPWAVFAARCARAAAAGCASGWGRDTMLS